MPGRDSASPPAWVLTLGAVLLGSLLTYAVETTYVAQRVALNEDRIRELQRRVVLLEAFHQRIENFTRGITAAAPVRPDP